MHQSTFMGNILYQENFKLNQILQSHLDTRVRDSFKFISKYFNLYHFGNDCF